LLTSATAGGSFAAPHGPVSASGEINCSGAGVGGAASGSSGFFFRLFGVLRPAGSTDLGPIGSITGVGGVATTGRTPDIDSSNSGESSGNSSCNAALGRKSWSAHCW
jgi:hypothetical protein